MFIFAALDIGTAHFTFFWAISSSEYQSGSKYSSLAHYSKKTEKYLQSHFNTSAALMSTSGCDADVTFFGCVPQAEGIIVFDEPVHAIARTCDAYCFSHGLVASFERCIAGLLKKRPEILAGKSTVFVAVKNLYSMDGDFSPLPQIVESLHCYIPKAYSHMVVDEAHTTGLYGSIGRGYVDHLGLQDEVDTVLQTFRKARGLTGAVILTSPIVRKYLVNYARPLIYTTSMPHLHLIAIKSTFELISGPEGDRLRKQVYECSQYFAAKLQLALKDIPETSPKLAEYLNSKGYVAQAIPFPIVPKGQERIRVLIHAENTFTDIDTFIAILLDWLTFHWYSKNTEVGAMSEQSQVDVIKD
ncbi:aminotransferase [Armillaria mellea]|nr:aminotransferase [Armillaria mellea]